MIFVRRGRLVRTSICVDIRAKSWRHGRICRYATCTQDTQFNGFSNLFGKINTQLQGETESINLNLPYRHWVDQHSDDAAIYLLHSLQKEHRLNPESGIAERWQQLKISGEDLPMQGPVADEIWRLLLQDIKLHQELFDHALETKSQSGILFDRLYEYLMGRQFLEVVPSEENHSLVIEWHERFLKDYFIRPGAMNELTAAGKASRSNLKLLQKIYRRGSCLPRHGIYDALVPELCKLKEWRLALDWHFFLYSQGDFPEGSSFMGMTFRKRPSMEEALAEFVSISSGKKMETSKVAEKPWTPSGLEHQIEDPDDIEEPAKGSRRHAPLSDAFCARLLATRSMSLSQVINTFEMFEHSKLGSLALRELMARTNNLDEAIESLELFENANISVGSSMYPRVIKHFIATKQYDLLQNLVQSDLHPHTLSDIDLQEKLLNYYVTTGDQMSGKRTTEIIKVARSVAPTKSPTKLGVRQDRSSEQSREWSKTQQIMDDLSLGDQKTRYQILLDDMIMQTTFDSRRSIRNLTRELLKQHSHSESNRDLWKFATNLCIRLIKSSQSLDPALWRFATTDSTYYGQEHDLFFLYSFYIREYYQKYVWSLRSKQLGAYKDRMANPGEELSSYLRANHVDNFAARYSLHQLNSAVTSWSFMRAIPHLSPLTGPSPDTPAVVFLSGLRFISELFQNGFNPNRTMISNALRTQLLNLFGHRESARRRNKVIKALNQYTFEEVLFHIEQVWAGPRLFPEIYQKPDIDVVDYSLHNIKDMFAFGKPKGTSTGSYPDDMTKMFLDLDQPPEPRIDAWKYKDYKALSTQYSGCLLDGLLPETTLEGTEPLSQEQRINRRIELRYRVLGYTPEIKANRDRTSISQDEWDTFIRMSAVMADRMLTQRERSPKSSRNPPPQARSSSADQINELSTLPKESTEATGSTLSASNTLSNPSAGLTENTSLPDSLEAYLSTLHTLSTPDTILGNIGFSKDKDTVYSGQLTDKIRKTLQSTEFGHMDQKEPSTQLDIDEEAAEIPHLDQNPQDSSTKLPDKRVRFPPQHGPHDDKTTAFQFIPLSKLGSVKTKGLNLMSSVVAEREDFGERTLRFRDQPFPKISRFDISTHRPDIIPTISEPNSKKGQVRKSRRG